jgi:hypothetical protein
VTPPCLRHHVGGQRRGVVGTDQPERVGGGERQVDQRLVQLALLQLVGPAVGPDRLADAAHPAAASRPRVRGHEARPLGDDAGRVAADHFHVGEEHLVRALAQRAPQEVEFPRPDHHEDGLVPLEPLLDEVAATLGELAVAGVEEGLVVKGRG